MPSRPPRTLKKRAKNAIFRRFEAASFAVSDPLRYQAFAAPLLSGFGMVSGSM
jgi:hypothetical protein